MNVIKNKSLDDLPKWRIFILLSAICLVNIIASLFMHRNDIPLLHFSDPDDSMRLVQVRDFLAGQSWFDVSQHRANPPAGGPMHWSRLVDLPISGSILLLRPLLGTHWAEVGAILIVPALTLFTLLFALYWAVRPLMGQRRALLCCAGFSITPFIFLQCGAMRIDHHAWQVVMMALVLGGTLHADARKGGLVAGIAIAVWLEISIEGLALAALTAAVMTLRYAVSAKEWPRVNHYFWALVITSLGLAMVMHGWKASLVPYCDSISPVYLAPLVTIPPFMMLFHRLLAQTNFLCRFLSVALAGGLAVVIFVAGDAQCLAGPFDTLDPMVYQLWYKRVLEGLPLWVNSADIALIVLLPSLIGIAACVIIFLREENDERRLNWLSLLVFTTGGTLLAVLVMRMGFVAHLLSIPGTAWLTADLFILARRQRATILRIPATLMTLPLLFPVLVIPLKSAALPGGELNNIPDRKNLSILEKKEFDALEEISPAVLFAPIDISPEILLRTSHAIIGTGHHRNAEGMKLVINAFVSLPEQARAIVLSSSATFLVVVPNAEVFRYRQTQPNGLAAQLLEGRVPEWLSPVLLPDLEYMHLYRINRKRS